MNLGLRLVSFLSSGPGSKLTSPQFGSAVLGAATDDDAIVTDVTVVNWSFLKEILWSAMS